MPIKSITDTLSYLEEIRNFLLTLNNNASFKLKNDLEQLSVMLKDDQWPKAVPPSLIADACSEESKMDRAEGICDLMIEQSLSDTSFLDFGCGEGHMCKYAINQGAKTVVGYDIRQSGTLSWDENNPMLTTDFNKVLDKSPYQIILVYDVIDHIEEEKSSDIMDKLKSVCNKKTKLYMRCHPWCSRHGGHYYTKINKAFIHLVFSEEELKNLGYNNNIHTSHVVHPLSNYRSILRESKFKIVHEDIMKTSVEPFFTNTAIVRDRIRKHWKNSDDDIARKWPGYQLEQSFIDYVIELE